MKVVVTGARGFLGWHLLCRLHATTAHEVVPVGRDNWDRLPAFVSGADAVIHVAGVNRASDDKLIDENVSLARDVAAVVAGGAGPAIVVFANSVQVGNGTAYAEGKARAAEELQNAVVRTGGRLVDVHLPNLFGEHGRPGYNSFVATFVDKVIALESPTISDREIGLLHAQGAAQALIAALDHGEGVVGPDAQATSVLSVWRTLERFHTTYFPRGDLPALADDFERDLFNTYRAALFPRRYPIPLTSRTDQRGRLVETVRAHGQGGQSFVSTTVPGVTRGEHYHLHTIERFVVLDGEAVIRLRRMFHDEIHEFPVSGGESVLIDMPTMWAHNITNLGDRDLTTLFWTSSLFDPEAPDTIPEPVAPALPEERP